MGRQQDTKRQQTNYKINKQQAIQKKIEACETLPMSVVHSEIQSVVTLSTLSFELMRTAIQTYFNNDAVLEYTNKCDQQDIIEQDIIKVFAKTKTNIKNKHMITINIYRTTSRALVNGPSINRFQNNIYPYLEKDVLDLYDCDTENNTKSSLQNALLST